MDREVFEQRLSEVCEYKYSAEHGGFVVTKLFKIKNPCEYGGAGKGCHIESRFCTGNKQYKIPNYWRHRCSHCGVYVNNTGDRATLNSSDRYGIARFYGVISNND